MIRARLSALLPALSAELLGDDIAIEGVSTDSRAVQMDKLFVCLKGDRFDAHDFAAQAVQNGAGALLVERQLDLPVPQVVVRDTRIALGRLAQWWRQQWGGTVVAITGSNGKTTTKQLMAAMLSMQGDVLATKGNFNNEIGMPLTLLELRDEALAVIEMGANHPGEIAYLASLAEPDYGVITNIGPAHLEGFGTVEGVARAKGELYARLPVDGVAALNVETGYGHILESQLNGRRTVTFGLNMPADVSATDIQSDFNGVTFNLSTPSGGAPVTLPLPGKHNVFNALAAAAVGHAMGMSAADVATGLGRVEPPKGRLLPTAGPHGSLLLDDSYNANPESLRAGIEFVVDAANGNGGEAWLALGDMSELGAEAEREHASAGRFAQQAGIKKLFAVGGMSAAAARAFSSASTGASTTSAGGSAEHFDGCESLAMALNSQLAASNSGQVAVLIKGSRSAKMERVVMALQAAAQSTENEKP